jgi:hypothetical protein
MRDDRGSFIKSNSQLTTELDALGATARGDVKAPYSKSRLDDDEESFSSGSLARQADGTNVPLPPSTANSGYQRGGSGRHSPVDNQGMFPADNAAHRGPPTGSDDRGMYNQGGYNGNEYGQGYARAQDSSPQPYGDGYAKNASPYPQPPHQYRQQNDSSPWQRGAGY